MEGNKGIKYTRRGSARPLNGCHVPRCKKGAVDVDDWSYDNDRWCFLEPCRILLRCQWHRGLALNASAPVTRLQWKPGGNVGEIIQWHTSHQNFYSTGQRRVTKTCRDGAWTMSFLPTAAYEVFGQMDGVSVRGRVRGHVRIRALVFEQHFS